MAKPRTELIGIHLASGKPGERKYALMVTSKDGGGYMLKDRFRTKRQAEAFQRRIVREINVWPFLRDILTAAEEVQ